jgi:cysteine-rich repeat protein
MHRCSARSRTAATAMSRAKSMCDDGAGNGFGNDCNSDCSLPTCGDGTVDPNEECDDGNDANGDGCDANCVIEPDCVEEDPVPCQSRRVRVSPGKLRELLPRGGQRPARVPVLQRGRLQQGHLARAGRRLRHGLLERRFRWLGRWRLRWRRRWSAVLRPGGGLLGRLPRLLRGSRVRLGAEGSFACQPLVCAEEGDDCLNNGCCEALSCVDMSQDGGP